MTPARHESEVTGENTALVRRVEGLRMGTWRGRPVASKHAVVTTLSTRIHNMNWTRLCEFFNSVNLSRILNRGC